MEMSLFHCCREQKKHQCLPYADIVKTHTCKNTLSLWRYNKPTWNASFTNGKHLYSTATWPLVIAAAFFVPVILRHLRLTHHDIAPTSPRHSVTVKGHRQKILKSQTQQTQRRDQPVAANESNHKRENLLKKNERVLIIDYIGLPSLNSLIYSGCLGIALDV